MQKFSLTFAEFAREMQLYCRGAAIFLWFTSQLLSCAQAQRVPVQQCAPPAVDSRRLCQHLHLGSCDFYTHCIDSVLSCTPQGFSQAYARRRCEGVRQLNASSAGSPLVSWAATQDLCLQRRLYKRLYSDSSQLSCLQFERLAFDDLEACYSSSQEQLCSSLKLMDSKAFQRDIPHLLEVIGVNEYYSSLAIKQVEQAIMSCNISFPVGMYFPTATVHHATFCIAGIFNPLATNYNFVAVLQKSFQSFGGTWVDLGKDWDWRCVTPASGLSIPADPSVSDYFHFVAWYPTSASLEFPSGTGSSLVSQKRYLYHWFDVKYSNETCGDGIQQAGELCDVSVYNGATLQTSIASPDTSVPSGCDSRCATRPGFECYTKAQGTSFCTLVTCGDGLKATWEPCDDGNNLDGDGCSGACTVEEGHECRMTGALSTCKRVLPPQSINSTVASQTATNRPPTLHSFAGSTVASASFPPQPSSGREVSFSAFLLSLFTLLSFTVHFLSR